VPCGLCLCIVHVHSINTCCSSNIICCAQCCLHVAITSDLFCSSSKLRKRKFYRRCFVFQVFSDVPVSPLDLLLALTLYLALLGKKTFALALFYILHGGTAPGDIGHVCVYHLVWLKSVAVLCWLDPSVP